MAVPVAKVLATLVKSKEGRKLIKTTIIGAVVAVALIIMIPIAIVESINPFKSNPELQGLGIDARDDPYLQALDEIKQEEGVSYIPVNMDIVRIIECQIVKDNCELEDVTVEEVKERMHKYYLSFEIVDHVIERELVDADTGEVTTEEEHISKKYFRSKSIEAVFESMIVDYPLLLDESVKLDIYDFYDMKKEIAKEYIHEGVGLPIEKQYFIYQEPFPEYLSGGKHDGVDLVGTPSTPILAVAAGEVVSLVDGQPNQIPGTFNQNAIDNNVKIKHVLNGKEVYIVYAHLQPTVAQFVQVGDVVEAGQMIGELGNSGMTTGYHLHFELREGCPTNECVVDPLIYFEFGKLRDNSNYTPYNP